MVDFCESMSFRNYIADGVRAISESVVAPGKPYLSERWYDLMHGKKPEEEETAEQIIERIRRKVEG